MSKPVAGTLIAANALTVNMRFAYLLNGASLATQVNSVGGAEALDDTNSAGVSIVTDGLAFSGAGTNIMQLPTAILNEFANGGIGIAGATLIIRYKGPNSRVCPSKLGSDSSLDEMPFSDGNFYCGWLDSARHTFTAPSLTYTNFNTIAVTAASGGSWKLYANGTIAQTLSQTGPVQLGLSGWLGGVAGFIGEMEFVYGWERILTPTEISDIASDPYTPIFTGADPSVADTITLSDGAVARAGLCISTGDTVSFSDVALGNWYKYEDYLSIYDAITYAIGFVPGGPPAPTEMLFIDVISLGDELFSSSRGGYEQVFQDQIVFSDELLSFSPYVTAAADTLAISDTAFLGKFSGSLFSDTLSFLDAAQPLRSEGETLTLSDSVTIAVVVFLPVDAGVAVGDAIELSDSVKFLIVPSLLFQGDILILRDEAFVYLNATLDGYLRRYLNDVIER